MAEAAGAKILSGVSKNLNILVAGPGAGSKADKAASLGTEIWDEAQFMANVSGGKKMGGTKRAAAAEPAAPAAKKGKKAATPKAAPAPARAAPAPARAAPLPAATASDIGSVNPVSGLSGSVLREDGELYDNDLVFSDAAANSNKFYRMQIVASGGKYHVVNHWGRIGTSGQNKVEAYDTSAQAIKEFCKKFKAKAGVAWADRASATSNATGKYRTLTEQRVAEAGGRIADDKTVCVCISWEKSDLDLHCKVPTGEECMFSNRNPKPFVTLDVDRMMGGVENIYLTTAKCDDGDYEYFVNYYYGAGALKFDFVVNQFGKKIEEGTGTVKKCNDKAPILTITMKKGKVTKTKFHLKAKEVPLD